VTRLLPLSSFESQSGSQISVFGVDMALTTVQLLSRPMTFVAASELARDHRASTMYGHGLAAVWSMNDTPLFQMGEGTPNSFLQIQVRLASKRLVHIPLKSMLTRMDVDVHHGVDGRVSESRLDRVRGVQNPEFSDVVGLSLAPWDGRFVHLQDGKI